MIELEKPEILCCPFCGSFDIEQKVEEQGSDDVWFMRCRYCGVSTGRNDNMMKSLDDWNNRVDIDFHKNVRSFSIDLAIDEPCPMISTSGGKRGDIYFCKVTHRQCSAGSLYRDSRPKFCPLDEYK